MKVARIARALTIMGHVMLPIDSLRGQSNDELMYVHDAAVMFARKEKNAEKLEYLERLIAACAEEEEWRDTQAHAMYGGFVAGVIVLAQEESRRFVPREVDREKQQP